MSELVVFLIVGGFIFGGALLGLFLQKLLPSHHLGKDSHEIVKLGAGMLLIEQMQNELPRPFLVVLIFWLTMLFASFGLFAPRNGTVIAVLLICACSVSAAIFLVLEMNQPLEGSIKVSSAPMLKALEHLGR